MVNLFMNVALELRTMALQRVMFVAFVVDKLKAMTRTKQ